MEYGLNIFGSQTKFEVNLTNVQIASDSLIPRTLFNIRVVRLPPEAPEISLSSILAEVFVDAEKEGGKRYLGTALAMQPYSLAGEQTITLYLDLDYYKIQQIEKIRKGEDFKLQLRMRGFATGIRHVNGKTDIETTDFSPAVLEYELPKSKWIEKFLKVFNFKHVRLFEFPKILPPESLSKAIEHLDAGWTQFSAGHYNKVLADCRLALEEVSTIVKKAGFKRKDKDEEGKEIEVPDWKKIFESENISDQYRHIFQKLMGFAALGAHTGKSINNEDALFALMITHALIYYIVEKYPT